MPRKRVIRDNKNNQQQAIFVTFEEDLVKGFERN